MKFCVIKNNGKVGDFTNSCLWISLVNYLQLVKNRMDVTVSKLREKSGFNRFGKNTDFDFGNAGHVACLIPILDEYKLILVIYTVRKNALPIPSIFNYGEHLHYERVHIMSYGAHFELLVKINQTFVIGKNMPETDEHGNIVLLDPSENILITDTIDEKNNDLQTQLLNPDVKKKLSICVQYVPFVYDKKKHEYVGVIAPIQTSVLLPVGLAQAVPKQKQKNIQDTLNEKYQVIAIQETKIEQLNALIKNYQYLCANHLLSSVECNTKIKDMHNEILSYNAIIIEFYKEIDNELKKVTAAEEKSKILEETKQINEDLKLAEQLQVQEQQEASKKLAKQLQTQEQQKSSLELAKQLQKEEEQRIAKQKKEEQIKRDAELAKKLAGRQNGGNMIEYNKNKQRYQINKQKYCTLMK
jgi:hypothetical protein